MFMSILTVCEMPPPDNPDTKCYYVQSVATVFMSGNLSRSSATESDVRKYIISGIQYRGIATLESNKG